MALKSLNLERPGLLAGKRGLIVGVANDKSIAWGITQAARREGADIQLTYQNESLRKRVAPLASSLGLPPPLVCDVTDTGAVAALLSAVDAQWDTLDFCVHAVAFSDRRELRGDYLETTRENFRNTMDVSVYSLTELCRECSRRMVDGGGILTLTYSGSVRVVPNYNVMGVAKAALEASVRYLACDLGPKGIRVNALSAGPIRTLAASGIGGGRQLFDFQTDASPLGRAVTIDEVGNAAVYLLSDLANATTGEIHHVDAGYNVVGVPRFADGQRSD